MTTAIKDSAVWAVLPCSLAKFLHRAQQVIWRYCCGHAQTLTASPYNRSNLRAECQLAWLATVRRHPADQTRQRDATECDHSCHQPRWHLLLHWSESWPTQLGSTWQRREVVSDLQGHHALQTVTKTMTVIKHKTTETVQGSTMLSWLSLTIATNQQITHTALRGIIYILSALHDHFKVFVNHFSVFIFCSSRKRFLWGSVA